MGVLSVLHTDVLYGTTTTLQHAHPDETSGDRKLPLGDRFDSSLQGVGVQATLTRLIRVRRAELQAQFIQHGAPRRESLLLPCATRDFGLWAPTIPRKPVTE